MVQFIFLLTLGASLFGMYYLACGSLEPPPHQRHIFEKNQKEPNKKRPFSIDKQATGVKQFKPRQEVLPHPVNTGTSTSLGLSNTQAKSTISHSPSNFQKNTTNKNNEDESGFCALCDAELRTSEINYNGDYCDSCIT